MNVRIQYQNFLIHFLYLLIVEFIDYFYILLVFNKKEENLLYLMLTRCQ